MSRRSLLNDLTKLSESNDAVKRGIEGYNRCIDQPEMKFFRDMLLTIKGTILYDMFSNTFTDLPPNEKDALQRAYFHINQLLDFLIEPVRYLQQKRAKTLSQTEQAFSQKQKERAMGGEGKEGTK